MHWIPSDLPTIAMILGLVLVSIVVPVTVTALMILRLPADYFTHTRRDPVYRHGRHPLAAWSLVLIKNLIGLVLVVVGIVMVFTPGQGLLTLLAGLMLVNFPGKYRLERRLVTLGPVIPAFNRLRARWGRAPLLEPEKD